jgi:hypothetical protein
MQFEPATPTQGTKVPASPEWSHEVKYDGFRLIVVRDGGRVRLLTRNGRDWSGRYPWITEAARMVRQKKFRNGREPLVGALPPSDLGPRRRKPAAVAAMVIRWQSAHGK